MQGVLHLRIDRSGGGSSLGAPAVLFVVEGLFLAGGTESARLAVVSGSDSE